jgi:hypothetical protein
MVLVSPSSAILTETEPHPWAVRLLRR